MTWLVKNPVTGEPAALTKRQVEVLRTMRRFGDSEKAELVYEQGAGCGWLGLDRVAPRTVYALLRLCAISGDSFSDGKVARYIINETGLGLLREIEESGK